MWMPLPWNSPSLRIPSSLPTCPTWQSFECKRLGIPAIFLSDGLTGLRKQAGAGDHFAIFCAGGLFCIQMYCDFAGYSEIAASSARLMGVRLMRNFDRPYLSQSYTEFFRRWHISLNRWFTSYVYIPLGGSCRGKGRKIRNTVIVFALCGLWHGARWIYVLWGLYAAFWLCVESLLDVKRCFGEKWDNPLGRLVRRSVMFLIFVPAELRLPESIESLPDGLFRETEKLTRLVLEHTASVCSVTENTFTGADQVQIYVPEAVYPMYRDGYGCETNPWEQYANRIRPMPKS